MTEDQRNRMPNESISSPEVPVAKGAYSHAVRNGRFLFVSGQLPIDSRGNVAAGSAGDHARQAPRNVHSILRAGGAELQHLVQVTIYVSDIADWPEVNSVYQTYLDNVLVLPARAIVPVKELHYGAKVEIQAIACLE
jgi:2-iminobutanoate/2-iminopropanoate deaminase